MFKPIGEIDKNTSLHEPPKSYKAL